MATMGRYCKAYPVARLREFSGWTENLQHLDPRGLDDEDRETAEPRHELRDDDYLFVQETYIVTDGIFLDEHVIFDAVTPEWRVFCEQTLQFEIPDYAVAEPA